MAKGLFASGKIEPPHPHELAVLQRLCARSLCAEPVKPVAQRQRVMQSQTFDVADPQPAFFDGPQGLGKRGDISAGKDVLRDPGVCGLGWCRAADAMDQGNPILDQTRPHRAEIA